MYQFTSPPSPDVALAYKVKGVSELSILETTPTAALDWTEM